jgi:dihydrofolate reductase
MARIIVTEFVSLDGVMESPGGGEDYKHAGWTFEINRGEEGNKFKIKETSDSEALLLGRVTYEGFAKALALKGGWVRGQVQPYAKVRDLVDAEESRLE